MIRFRKVYNSKVFALTIWLLLLSKGLYAVSICDGIDSLRVPLKDYNRLNEAISTQEAESDLQIIPPVFVPISPFDMRLFTEVVSRDSLSELSKRSKAVKSIYKRDFNVWHINSIKGAGGVSDILNGLLSLSISDICQIDSKWFVITGNDKFFATTAKIHEILHGREDLNIEETEWGNYFRVLGFNCEHLLRIKKDRGIKDPDIIVLHDQQPLGMITFLKGHFPNTKFIWRGHIPYKISNDPEKSSNRLWRRLRGFVNNCDASIFHLKDYRPYDLDERRVCYIQPSINPIGLINRSYGREFQALTLEKYEIELAGRTLVGQNGRFDVLKDPVGVIEAYRKSVLELVEDKKIQLKGIPKLLLFGPVASDNDRNLETLKEACEKAEQIEEELQVAIGNRFSEYSGESDSIKQNIFVCSLDPGKTRLDERQKQSLVLLKEHILRARDMEASAANIERVDLDEILPPSEQHELEIAALLDSCEVLIAKSTEEGFNLAAISARYRGKAVIMSEVGGLAVQIIDEGKNPGKGTGFYVGRRDKDDGKALFDRDLSIKQTAEYISYLVRNPKEREEMGERARDEVTDRYLVDRHLSDYLKLFIALKYDRRINRIRKIRASL